jgi:hypoxanthine phosphoribosyltransferase
MQIHDLTFKPMISTQQIADRVGQMGGALKQQFGEHKPLFISILSGAFVFASDLIRAFDAPCEVGFVKLSSYSGTQSGGTIQKIMGLEDELTNRHIIVVEDIVDTGRTLHYFQQYLQEKMPASITTITLLRKPDAIQFPAVVDMVGFDIPDEFVVGYGLDYDGLGRNLPGIMVKA